MSSWTKGAERCGLAPLVILFEQDSRTDPSRLGKALQYALGRWEALTRYTHDGRLAIDNNLAERLLRGIAISRKNSC